MVGVSLSLKKQEFTFISALLIMSVMLNHTAELSIGEARSGLAMILFFAYIIKAVLSQILVN